MTQVKFYIIPGQAPNSRELTACRLTEKILGLGKRVFIHTDSPGSARRLDEMLWTFRADSFVPHGLYPADEDDPALRVLIGHDTAPERETDVLINLTDAVPPFFGRFSQVVELVNDDETVKAQGRERFRFYRDRGYDMQTHQLR